jgi:hypothetical protein
LFTEKLDAKKVIPLNGDCSLSVIGIMAMVFNYRSEICKSVNLLL